MPEVGNAVFKATADFSSIRTESLKATTALKSVDTAADQIGTTATKSFGQAGKAAVGFQATLGTVAAKTGALGQKMSLGLTLPLTILGGVAVKTFADFDTAIRKTAANAGATGEEFDAIREKALEMGAKTAFSATEAAQGMFELTAAGLSGSQAMEAIEATMLLASASGTDLATSSALVAQAINAFGLEAKDAGVVADILTEAANQSAITVEGLGEALAHAGQLGATANQDLSSVVAGIQSLVNQGIPAAQAGTALAQAFQSLKSPLENARQLMNDFDIEVRNADGSMKQLPDVVRELEQDLSLTNPKILEMADAMGISAAEARDHALNVLFGVEGMKAMGLMLNTTKTFAIGNADAMKDLARVTEVMGQAWVDAHKQGEEFVFTGADAIEVMKVLGDTSAGTAKKFDDAMKKSVGRRLEELKGSIETLVIRIVDALLPALEWLVALLIKAANKAADFAKAHPEIVRIAVAFAAVLAAAGPALIVFSKIVSAVRILIPIIGALTSPVTLVVLAIAALGVGLYLLYTKVKPVRQVMNEIAGVFKKVWEAFQDGGLVGAVDALRKGFDKLSTPAKIVLGILGGIALAFVAITAPALAVAVALVYAYQKFEGFRDAVNAAFEEVKRVAWIVFGFLRDEFNRVVEWFESRSERIGKALHNIGVVIGLVMDAVMWVVRQGLDVVMLIWEYAGQHILDAVRIVWDLIKGVIHGALTVIMGIVDFVLAVLTLDWDAAWQAILSILSGIWQIIVAVAKYGIETVWNTIQFVMGVLRAGWEFVWGIVGGVVKTVWDTITGFVQTGVDTVAGIIGGFLRTVLDVWNFVWGIISSIPGAAIDAGRAAVIGVLNGIIDVLNTFIGAINWILGVLGIDEIGEIGKIDAGTGAKHEGFGAWRNAVPTFHSGGLVGGSQDEILAKLLPGEFVMSRKAVGEYGPDLLKKMNRGKVTPEHTGVPGTGGVFDFLGDLVGDILRGGAQAIFAPIRDLAYAAIDATPKVLGGTLQGLAKLPIKAIDDLLHERDEENKKRAMDAGPQAGPQGMDGLQQGIRNVWAAVQGQFGQRFSISSGYRPNSITNAGNQSYHGTGQAIDIVPPDSGLYAFLRDAVSRLNIVELIYQHEITKHGARSYYGPNDHFDHVHVAAAMRGMLVDRDGPVWTHAKEMILPPDLSGGLQQLIAGGGQPMVGELHVHESVDPRVTADITLRRLSMAVHNRVAP